MRFGSAARANSPATAVASPPDVADGVADGLRGERGR